MRVVMISTHYLGVLYLNEILAAGDEVVAAVNYPDTWGFYVPPEYEFRSACFRKYIPVYEPDPDKLNSTEFLDILEALEPDYIISGYYPKIFKKRLLELPKFGCINTHPTGLPKYRGLSPYYTHMWFGEEFNQITMHWLDAGVDTGDIIAKAKTPITDDDTGFTTGHKNTEAARDMFREMWLLIKAGKAPRQPQNEKDSSVFNFDWSMLEIDWSAPAREIWYHIRTLTRPFDGMWTMACGNKLRIWGAEMVPEDQELKFSDAGPGEVLAITGKGLWVQCGKSQLRIMDSNFEDDPDVPTATIIERVVDSNTRLILG